MAYDSSAVFGEQDVGVKTRPVNNGRKQFRRLERFDVLAGGLAIGAGLGFTAAIGAGRPSMAMLIVSGAVFVTLALYLSTQTLRESIVRRAYGCSIAATVHAGALLAWPLAGLFAPVNAVAFWSVPAIAVSGLVLFASCWDGPPRAVYRLGLQGGLVAGLAAFQGALVIMAG